jgi:hypothetical protein
VNVGQAGAGGASQQGKAQQGGGGFHGLLLWLDAFMMQAECGEKMKICDPQSQIAHHKSNRYPRP